MNLSDYQLQVLDLLHDINGTFYSLAQVTRYINKARQQVAAQGECVRVLPTNSGGVASYSLTAGGTGYSSPPTVTLSAPQILGGVQATATATVGAGAVTAIVPGVAGSGYVIPPTVTFGGPGAGAAASTTLTVANYTVANQEVYTFASRNAFVTGTPGVQNILAVKQIAIYWGNLKPALNYAQWGDFNAFLRAYSIALTNFPSWWSQFGQGESGTVYLWPVPSQPLGMDWDCICQPLDLVDNGTPEAIPDPWTDAVQYYAAYLALMGAQRAGEGEEMFNRFNRQMLRSRAFSSQTLATNYYGSTWY